MVAATTLKLYEIEDHAQEIINEAMPVDIGTTPYFLHELWAEEVVKTYKDQLIYGRAALKLTHEGVKHIPIQ
jgi:hypothetical protein